MMTGRAQHPIQCPDRRIRPRPLEFDDRGLRGSEAPSELCLSELRPGNVKDMLRRLAPWLIIFEVLRAGRDHWGELDPSDRARVSALMRRTRGNPRNLTVADRDELRDLGRRLRLGRLVASMAGAAVAGRRRHGRRAR